MFAISRLRSYGWLAVILLLFGSIASAQDSTSTTCVPQQPEGWVAYTLQDGNTLSDIAARTGSTAEELARVNCITDRARIVAGVVIFVPRLPDDDNVIAERCELAGIEAERCRAIFGRDDKSLAERCRNAGITPERCRSILNGDDSGIAERCRLNSIEPERCRAIFGRDDDSIAERCRLNEIEPERCRAILYGEDSPIVERCRNAGIEPERCRELANGDENNIGERCRLAGIEPERCRELYNDANETPENRNREVEPDERGVITPTEAAPPTSSGESRPRR